ncbi:1,4-dihydroxy-2-naphthoate octaprenyltransferase [Chloroherpeton thalassium ATCC 35110]|uniref:1,4-dihydroxy-2-naphthoate octaprenyltransferase n=1 Tax=Chloroherpeton thalassium (strain ATCC 35110 / GB-78) TaxID=517418 RepID=B3QXE0_CHLT3|nr:1,4-dihydroxy-2-naphthoate polyprenyltransferase [Chloroherpeton thalassium]ACF13414.1 1,4-dihydroxy-2-naphthoate octaprenyltransferase [Chloroherpeton thalassium ATCC 35110]
MNTKPPSIQPAPKVSAVEAWMHAIRPKTLPAGAMPVVLGAALALADGKFSLWPALIALVCALLIQVATNFINEIYDNRKGADTAERLGPTRAVASGMISEQVMTRVSISMLVFTFVLGLYLVKIGGWPILLVGLLSLFFAWGYTGGPYPLAYNGLGEVFVFIFFGIIAVVGTYYVQALSTTSAAFIVSLAPGAIASNILGVNNIRDIETDAKVNKRTLAVKIGLANAQKLYVFFNFLAFFPPVFLFMTGYSASVFLPFLSAPMAIRLSQKVYRLKGKPLNEVLAGTGVFLTIHGLLFSVGLILASF